MREGSHWRLGSALVAALFALGAGWSFALASEPASTEDAPEPAVSADATPPQDPREAADAVSSAAADAGQQILALLEQAREDDDVMRITCLEDKRARVAAHRAALEERRLALEAALTADDAATAAHQSATIDAVGRAVEALSKTAAQCVGEGGFDVPPAAVTASGPAGLEDPGVLPEVPSPDVPNVPPPASGFF